MTLGKRLRTMHLLTCGVSDLWLQVPYSYMEHSPIYLDFGRGTLKIDPRASAHWVSRFPLGYNQSPENTY